MKQIGICFINPASDVKPEYLKTMANMCEEMGLHSFWVSDRIVYDNLEPLCTLAAVAAITDKIRIGTCVLLVGPRHPVLLAKTVATLDFLSGGRMTLGIGLGNRENDFTAAGVPFQHRGSRVEEAVKLVKKLWTEENVSHQGKFFQVENVSIGPRPIQSPHPPIWMGGYAELALKRVARLADGYICSASAIHEFPSVWEKLSGFVSAAGRKPEDIERAGLTYIAIDENKSRAVAATADYFNRYYGKVWVDIETQLLVGSPEACAERISSFFEKGLNTLLIGPVKPDIKQLELLGEKVLPLVKP